jgi:MtaA/CmuA family methyltransferase
MAWAANYVGHAYKDYYLDGDVLVEAQLAVTRAFNLDQISAISDPWREASAYGVEFDYPPDGIGKPRDMLIKTHDDISRLQLLDIEKSDRMKQRVESVGKMAGEVGQTHSVLGWIEGPLAEYADLRGLESALIDLIDKPEMFSDAADVIVQNAITFALAQVEVGADMIGIGDAAASLIGGALYKQYVLPLEQKLITAIHEVGATVKLHICGNTIDIVQHMAKTGADIIDVDWMNPLDKVRELIGPEVTLCGNFDPSAVLLQGSAQDVANAARNCLKAAGDRFILMPGCEVPPATPEENIRAFCPCDGCLIPEELRL